MMSLEPILDQLIKENQITNVVMEAVQYQKNIDTFQKLSQLLIFLKYFFVCRGISIEEPIPVNVWRKKGVRKLFQLSKGDKETLYHYLNDYFGKPDHFNPDVSDAIGLGVYFGRFHLTYENMELTIKRVDFLQI